MAKIIESSKNFKVIEVSLIDMIKIGSFGICDHCNGKLFNDGYYVAVLNSILCKECYEEWHKNAKYYTEDKQIENGNFNRMKQIVELK